MKRFILLLIIFLQTRGLAAAVDPAVQPTDQASRQHLQEILDRPQFQAWRRRLAEKDFADRDWDFGDTSWLNRKLKDFGNWIDSWFTRGRNQRPITPSERSDLLPTVLTMVAWGTVIVGVVSLIVLLVVVLMREKANPAAARILSRKQIEEAMETGDALALDADQWMSEADRLATEQNFRAVYRALYLALLSGLHSLGKIEHRQSRTNWTYVQRYQGPGEERQTFGELTELFDRVWYGRFSAASADLPGLQRKVAELTAPRRPA